MTGRLNDGVAILLPCGRLGAGGESRDSPDGQNGRSARSPMPPDGGKKTTSTIPNLNPA
jgi:hypothetical protein